MRFIVLLSELAVNLYYFYSLCVHVGPSQPSLQTQVNDSPVTTQVPPFSHGLGRQLEFLAKRGGKKKGRKTVSELSPQHLIKSISLQGLIKFFVVFFLTELN